MILDITIPPLAIIGASVLTAAALFAWAWREATKVIDFRIATRSPRMGWDEAEAQTFALAAEAGDAEWDANPSKWQCN